MQPGGLVPHPDIAVIEKPLPAAPVDADAEDADHQLIVARFEIARTEHLATAASVRATLDAAGLPYAWFAAPARPEPGAYRVLITVGGDGTFLLAARLAGSAAVVGINSSPGTSVGRYCVATGGDVRPVLGEILRGARAPSPLMRLRVTVDDAPLPRDAINDALFANRCPVAATRYAIIDEAGLDLQLSSGIWIATPTGSSGAIRSAGGEVVADDDDRLQWRVREPFIGGGRSPRRPRALHGFTREGLTLLSRHDDNAIYLDGQPQAYPAPFGARVRIFPSPEPLLAHLPVSLPR